MTMGDDRSDKHLKIFKCLVDTGADVLRSTLERKVLKNNAITFEQYLDNVKHQCYHQFEKNRNNPCCSSSPHVNCKVKGNMDKNIFEKVYIETAKLDTYQCLDRFKVIGGVSPDKLDLSDLNFFLWNSKKLSDQEKQSLQTIMQTRKDICHPESTQHYSIDELESFWESLEKDILLFAEPYRYKKMVTLQITTLKKYKINELESERIIKEMATESEKIIREMKLEVQTRNDCTNQLMKEESVGIKNCIKDTNDKTTSFINETAQKLEENHKVLTRCIEEIKTTVTEDGSNTRLHSEDQRRAIDSHLTESENRVCQTVIHSGGRLEDKLSEQQNEIRKHNVELNAETEMRIDKRVAQLATKMEEEAHETRRQFKTGLKILLGVIGKQNITLGINQEQIEQLIESSDARDIYITSKLDQQCLTEDKEKNVIENLQSEIPIPPSNDINSDPSDKQAFQVIVKKVNSIILKLKATPGIFKSVETLKSALLTLVENVHTAGKIDAEIEDTITVDLSFDSPLTKDQISVVKCLFSKEWNDENNDKTLSKEYTSSAKAKIESYPEHETSSQQAVTIPLCQACAEKDKQIKAYEEKTREHENSIKFYKLQVLGKTCAEKDKQIQAYEEMTREHEKSIELNKLQGKSEYLRKPTYQSLEEKFKQIAAIEAKVQENQKITAKYKLQGVGSTIRPYNCRNCFEKDDIIIQLDRQLCQIRRHLFQIKENQLEKSVSEGDLVKLITLAADTICADESTRIAEKETKSNISSLRSDKMAVDSDVHLNRTKTLREDIEIQSGEGSLDKPYHPSEKSDVNSRLLEIKREYARNFYTKTAEQKGLALIFRTDRRRCFHPRDDHDVIHLEDFFEEIGFIVKRTEESDHRKLLKYMTDGQFYCVFIVLMVHHGFGGYDEYPIRHLSSQNIGKPVIIVTDFTLPAYHIADIKENNDILIVQPTMQGSIGPYGSYGESNIFDDFVKAARRNQFADIMDILTRMNALYEYPIITFQSSLRKKFCFL